MRRDKTVIRRPRKTAGRWVAHCELCDHLMYGNDFEAVRFNVELHRVASHWMRPLPRRCPGASLWLEAPSSLLRSLIDNPDPVTTDRAGGPLFDRIAAAGY
ncbi:hypothetical protein [Glycomyces sp. YM15]|uniref:hypothetical protein n=1 Tax=Glycomyces sp. YM15 TaxID=2800446 RepID=UPI001963A8DF|nr:hypothetical protein [Glycomyces sp. YM15]